MFIYKLLRGRQDMSAMPILRVYWEVIKVIVMRQEILICIYNACFSLNYSSNIDKCFFLSKFTKLYSFV